MLKRIWIAVVVIAPTLVLLGCNSSSSEPSASSAFQGDWTRACFLEEEGLYVVDNVTISGSSLLSSIFRYTDANCTNPSIPAELKFFANIEFPGGSTTTPLGEAPHINFTPTGSENDGIFTVAEQAQVIYSIGLVSDGKLYDRLDDDEFDGSTIEKRSTEINESFFWVRQ